MSNSKKQRGRPARNHDNKAVRLALLSKSLPVETVSKALAHAGVAQMFGLHAHARCANQVILKIIMTLDSISTQSVSEMFGAKNTTRYYREASRLAASVSGQLRAYL